ncbi:MAG: hypothetical protein WC436_04150 [Candidatus Babeliales bacterium]
MKKLFFVIKIFVFCFINIPVNLITKDVLIETENFYSENLKKEIVSSLKNYICSEKASKNKLGSICSQLKKKYRIIKKIELNYIAPDNIECKITAARPLFTVNNKFVITDKKRLFDYSIFELFDKNKINNFFVLESFLKDKMPIKIYDFLKNLSKDITDNYYLIYKKPTQIFLKPKNFDCNNNSNNNFFILLDSNSINLNKIKNMENIKNMSSNVILNKKLLKKCKLFDLRFNNRILVKFVGLDFWGRGLWD